MSESGWDGKWFRRGLSFTLIAVALYCSLPYIFNIVSNDGIINAHINVVLAPNDGVISGLSKTKGSFFNSGEELLRLDQELPIILNSSGILANVYVANGQSVAKGVPVADIVDCKNIFIESEISESKIDVLRVGNKVNYRLYGSRDWHSGEIVRMVMAGAYSISKSPTFLKFYSKNKMAVAVIKVNMADIHADVNNNCNLDRKVVVSYPRNWSLDILRQ